MRGGLAVLLGACALLVAPATAAAAQDSPCLPQPAGDYPPAPPVVDLEGALELGGGTLRPNGEGTLDLTGARPDADYCAVLFSVPITIPATRSAGDGGLGLRPAVPVGFELAAGHHLDVYRGERLVGSFDFCVDREGTVVADQATGCDAIEAGGRSLVRTGLDHLLDLLRLAAVACAVGAFALYLRRRRLEERALHEIPIGARRRAPRAPSGRPAGRRPSGRSARGRPRG